jgi:predicted transcriptional regulator
MSSHSITIELPENVFDRLTQLAQTTDQPLAEIIAQSIASNLPPLIDQASPELQPELLKMQRLSDPELLSIAQTAVSLEQQRQHEELLIKNEDFELSDSEQQELTNLRLAMDRLTVCKAYAWALLRWRGHRIPALSEIPG